MDRGDPISQAALDRLLDELEAGLDAVDALPDSIRDDVLRLLDGVEVLHRTALVRLGELIGARAIEEFRADPAVAWLFDAYGIGIDQHTSAEAALDAVRPYVHSHGGQVELIDVVAGVVRIRLAGACAGCTASADTLRERIEAGLREQVPGFVAVEAEEDEDAEPHPPPVGPVPVELSPRPDPATGHPQR